MHKYTIPDDDNLTIANEPAVSSYYTRPMIAGLRSHLQRRLQNEDNLQALLRVESALAQDGEESFSERYARMKEYTFSHFDKAFAEEMRNRNFLIGEPQPCNDAEFENLDKMFEEAEASGECTEKEVEQLFEI